MSNKKKRFFSFRFMRTYVSVFVCAILLRVRLLIVRLTTHTLRHRYRHTETHTHSSHRCSLSIQACSKQISYTQTINWTPCIFNIISHSCFAEPMCVSILLLFFLSSSSLSSSFRFVSFLLYRISIIIMIIIITIEVVALLNAFYSYLVCVYSCVCVYECVVCLFFVSFIFIVYIYSTCFL